MSSGSVTNVRLRAVTSSSSLFVAVGVVELLLSKDITSVLVVLEAIGRCAFRVNQAETGFISGPIARSPLFLAVQLLFTYVLPAQIHNLNEGTLHLSARSYQLKNVVTEVRSEYSFLMVQFHLKSRNKEISSFMAIFRCSSMM